MHGNVFCDLIYATSVLMRDSERASVYSSKQLICEHILRSVWKQAGFAHTGKEIGESICKECYSLNWVLVDSASWKLGKGCHLYYELAAS